MSVHELLREAQPPSPPICRDCLWKETADYPHCLAPQAKQNVDLVTGKTDPYFCNTHRMPPSSSGYCGPEGRFFKSRDPAGEAE